MYQLSVLGIKQEILNALNLNALHVPCKGGSYLVIAEFWHVEA